MPKSTFTVKDDHGNWIEIDPMTVKSNPIVHRDLSDSLLARIRTVYEAMRDVVSFNGHPMSLEQFELSFMREVQPMIALKMWEAIAAAYTRACRQFPNDIETRRSIYHWLILLVMGGVSDAERQQEEVKIISQCFAAVYPTPAEATARMSI